MRMRWLVIHLVVATLATAQGRLEILEATIIHPEDRRLSAFKYHDAYRDARLRVRTVTGAWPPNGLIIELVPDIVALNRILEAAGAMEVPGWVAGVALPDRGKIIIRLDLRTPAPERVLGLLTHELCHLVVHAIVKGEDAQPVPRWLDEGLAQYAEGRPFSPERPKLAMRAFFRQLISLDELERSFPRSEGASGLAYAQAKSFIDWLARQRVGEPFPELLAHLRDGTTIDDAMHLVFRSPLDVLEDHWRDHLRSDRSWVPAVLMQLLGGVLLGVATVLGASRIVARRRRARALLERTEDDEQGNDESAMEDRARGPDGERS